MTDQLAPLCSNCSYGFLGLTGVFCTMFNQPVEEMVAAECPEFDPIALPEVTVTVNGQKASSTVEELVPATWAESHSDHELSDDELVAACDRWLAASHVTLWGQHFEVISPGRAQAAQWLAAQIRSLDASLLTDDE